MGVSDTALAVSGEDDLRGSSVIASQSVGLQSFPMWMLSQPFVLSPKVSHFCDMKKGFGDSWIPSCDCRGWGHGLWYMLSLPFTSTV